MNNLKKYRENAGLSQIELSKLTKCARSYICEVESGHQKMSAKMAERMSEVLHQSASTIMGGDAVKYSGGFSDSLRGLLEGSFDEIIEMRKVEKISQRDFDIFMICWYAYEGHLSDDDISALRVTAKAMEQAHSDGSKEGS